MPVFGTLEAIRAGVGLGLGPRQGLSVHNIWTVRSVTISATSLHLFHHAFIQHLGTEKGSCS